MKETKIDSEILLSRSLELAKSGVSNLMGSVVDNWMVGKMRNNVAFFAQKSLFSGILR